jgi:hypothetical protein
LVCTDYPSTRTLVMHLFVFETKWIYTDTHIKHILPRKTIMFDTYIIWQPHKSKSAGVMSGVWSSFELSLFGALCLLHI